jgi:hypothetical protein
MANNHDDELDGGLPPGGLPEEEPPEPGGEQAPLDEDECFEVFDEDGYPICAAEDEPEALPPAEGRDAPPEETREPCPQRRIDRVWVWLHGDILQVGYGSDPARDPPGELAALVDRCAALDITDVVLSLNSHRGDTRVSALPDYTNAGGLGSRRARDLFQAFSDRGIAVHYMIFVVPDPAFIERAATRAAALASRHRPRSIHFDAERWWLRYDLGNQADGVDAIREHFVEHWSADRPALGMGATLAALPARSGAGLPRSLASLLGVVDFAIPQMYASLANYPSACGSMRERARRHYQLCLSALGSTEDAPKKVVAGQTANPEELVRRHRESQSDARTRLRATPALRDTALQRMQNILDAVLTLGDRPVDYVREVSYWSSGLLHTDSRRRAFVTHVAGLARAGSLQPGFTPPAGLSRQCRFPE